MTPSSSDKTIRVAIIGLGKMGVMHAAMIETIEGAEIVGLVDLDAKLAEQVRSMGVAAPHFQAIETCLAQAKPDAVVISTPQFTHRAIAEPCLRAGVAVMCEKPLAHTLADARAMLALANEHPDVPTAVGLMLGHHPLFNEAARIVHEGVLGEVKAARASCYLSQVFKPLKGWTFQKGTAGGGVVINSGSHLLYLLLHVLGPAKGVMARGGPVHNQVEDTLSALVDFESGVAAAVDISWSVPGYEFQTHDITIEGTNGTLEVGNEVMRLWLVKESGTYPKGWTQKKRGEAEPKGAFSLSPDYCGDEFYLEDLDFIGACREGRSPKVGWNRGFEVQALVDALYRSMDSKAYADVEKD